MQKIALFGAAGAIGTGVADALRAQGRPYRVVGRSRVSLAAAFGADPLAEIVTWNPDDPESIRAAARGVDAIVYLVGVDYWKFALHPVLMERTLAAATAEGVARLLLIGTVYPYGRPRTAPVREDHPREPHTYKGRMRKQQEDLLLDAHRTGSIQGAVLRLPDFFGPGVDKSLLHGAFVAGVKGTTGDLIGPLDRPHQFAYVPDVGPIVRALIDDPTAYGRVWHYAGSGTTSQRAVLDEIERQTGRRLKTRVVGKTLLRVLGLFNPMMREMVEMHYLLTDPVLMDDGALETHLGGIARTNYADAVRACLAAAGRGI